MSKQIPELTADKIELFWSRVNVGKKEECWEWKTGRTNYGYGQFAIKKEGYRTHRVAWVLHNKKQIPEGLFVCHKCDNPPCCNPHHLYAGTPKDNVRDDVKRRNDRIGKNNPRATPVNQLTLDGNFIKRWDYMVQAEQSGIAHQSSISRALRGKQKSAGGYKWEYATQKLIPKKLRNNYAIR